MLVGWPTLTGRQIYRKTRKRPAVDGSSRPRRGRASRQRGAGEPGAKSAQNTPEGNLLTTTAGLRLSHGPGLATSDRNQYRGTESPDADCGPDGTYQWALSIRRPPWP